MSRAVMALDPGSKRVGVAVSDAEGKIAMPKAVIDRTQADFMEQLIEIVEQSDVAEVVVGLPVNMDGSEGPSARLARIFAEEVSERLALPVKLIDERLTTVSAASSMRRAGTTSREQRGKVDKVAAALMLQGYLDSRAP